MRKLLLASDGNFLIEKGYDLLGIPKERIKIAYIITASKGGLNRKYVDAHEQKMRDAGLDFQEMDIENRTEVEIEKMLEGKNVIHVEGGNTFYLLKAVKESGFDKILERTILKEVVYVGTSAGAYIACPTIETSTWGPNIRDNYGLTNFTALNFVPFLMKVHYKDDMEDLVREKMKTASRPVRILRDGQGILVENDSYFFKGEGEEVKLNENRF